MQLRHRETLRSPDFGMFVTQGRVGSDDSYFVPLPESDVDETGGPLGETERGEGSHQTFIEGPKAWLGSSRPTHRTRGRAG